MTATLLDPPAAPPGTSRSPAIEHPVVVLPSEEALVARRRVLGVPPPPDLPLPSGGPVDPATAPLGTAPSLTWGPAPTPPPLRGGSGRVGDLLMWWGALTVVVGYVSAVVAYGPPACPP